MHRPLKAEVSMLKECPLKIVKPHISKTQKRHIRRNDFDICPSTPQRGRDREITQIVQPNGRKVQKLNLLVKNRLPTNESQQSDVDIEMLKNEMELLNNKKYIRSRNYIQLKWTTLASRKGYS